MTIPQLNKHVVTACFYINLQILMFIFVINYVCTNINTYICIRVKEVIYTANSKQ